MGVCICLIVVSSHPPFAVLTLAYRDEFILARDLCGTRFPPEYVRRSRDEILSRQIASIVRKPVQHVLQSDGRTGFATDYGIGETFDEQRCVRMSGVKDEWNAC